MSRNLRLFAFAALLIPVAWLAVTHAADTRSTSDRDRTYGRMTTSRRDTTTATTRIGAAGTRSDTSAMRTGHDLSVNFSDMAPHVGQKLYIRVVRDDGDREVHRDSIAVHRPDFEWTAQGILKDGSDYRVDLWADMNRNREYDPPEGRNGDHAWRLEIDDPDENVMKGFEHTADFTDIKWPFDATVRFTGMAPHVGRTLHARLVKAESGDVVASESLAVRSPRFDISLPGVEPGEEYYIDVFADVNRDGRYEDPPTDHAWRLDLREAEGDTTITFRNNTNFTDIDWRDETEIEEDREGGDKDDTNRSGTGSQKPGSGDSRRGGHLGDDTRPDEREGTDNTGTGGGTGGGTGQ